MARIVNGVNLEKFIALEGQMIQPVPKPERDNYVYWRAASLGRIALNFLNGHMTLSTPNAGQSIYTKEYIVALNRALGRVTPDYLIERQYSAEDREVLARMTGLPYDFIPPAMVLALDNSFNDGARLEEVRSLYTEEGSEADLFDLTTLMRGFNPCGGHRLLGPLKLESLDPFSRQAIRDIFGLQNDTDNKDI